MNITDMKHASQTYTLELTCGQKLSITKNTPVRVYIIHNRVHLSLFESDTAVEVKGASRKDQENLERILVRNSPFLAVYEASTGPKKFVVTFQMYAERHDFNMQIGIDDQFLAKVKKTIKIEDFRQPQKTFEQMFIIQTGIKRNVVFGYHTQKAKEYLFDQFLLAGDSGYLVVNRRKTEDGDVFFEAETLKSGVSDEYRFVLLRGEVKFQNNTELEKARLDTLVQMEQIGDSLESYLNTWERYGEIEAENIVKHVEEVGYLNYVHSERVGNGVIRLDFENIDDLKSFTSKLLKDDTTLTLSSLEPTGLFLTGITLKEYKKFEVQSKADSLPLQHCVITEPIQPREGRVFVKPIDVEGQIPENGYIFLSLAGDASRIERRQGARQRIIGATGPMPNLAAILAGKSVVRSQRSYIEPLSEKTKDKIFKNPPTPRQREAIEIALNTPDIAIIQGPPGTGKTTVILGILERLNEISDSTDDMFARNLVTAFQHDAVQNVVDRLEILGLPSMKFGKKRGKTGNDESLVEMTVDNWIHEKFGALHEKYPEYRKTKHIEQFDRLHRNYLYSANTKDNTIRLLKEVERVLENKLPVELSTRLYTIITKLEMSHSLKSDPDKDYLIRKIYSLPVNPIKYEDNGEDIIREVLFRVKRQYSNVLEKQIAAMERFIRGKRSTEDFLLLKQVRKSILVHLLPKEEIFYSPKQKEDILILLTDISEHLMDESYKTQSGEDLIVLHYMQQFENNPLTVQNAVKNYISVIGATNQQALSYKVIQEKNQNTNYDNVLVDEAARSNPLDLFIPLSLARDRIILVGDHRQLPHIVDDAIVKKIGSSYESEKSVSEIINDNIHKSMFEYLFKKMKELEKIDGIKRTITLDKQYRTHPILGRFVSDNFYRVHGEVDIESGLPAKNFAHRLPDLENKAAVWLNVPHHEGGEISKQSKSRPIEAEKIVRHLKSLIDSPEAKGLNFGIITFYADQVNAIYEELLKYQMAEKAEDGSYNILNQYREEDVNGKKIEKLRIGTVDAFQGMEFDVVYLSMVRSNTFSDGTEKQRQKKYGFLMVENRLCVSMSRQKKMLIVAGDKGILETPNAEEAVRPLVNYYQLCKEDSQYGKII